MLQFTPQQVILSHVACCCGSNPLCCRSDNLFQQLENRSLTNDEQKIIQNRVSKRLVPYINTAISLECIYRLNNCGQVDLQRRMLVAYERQEKTRKVSRVLGAASPQMLP